MEYTFASDFWPHGAAARAYGVFNEETGAPFRGTFLIDKDGSVIWSLVKVKDERRTEMVPESLDALHETVLSLHLEEWGPRDAPRVVCLHGVTGHGRHFAKLAERLPGFHVLAPDLLGHGSSPYEPPWDIETHSDAVVDTVGAAPAISIGHSFGGRLASRARGASAEAGAEARPARPRDPRPSTCRALRRRERAEGTRVRLLRGGDRPTLRREPALPRAPRARRGGAAWSSRLGGRQLPVPLQPIRSRGRVRRDGVGAAAVRAGPHSHAARARRALVSPLRPPAGCAPGRARRSARGRRRPRRAHRALGRARRDGRGRRRVPRRARSTYSSAIASDFVEDWRGPRRPPRG